MRGNLQLCSTQHAVFPRPLPPCRPTPRICRRPQRRAIALAPARCQQEPNQASGSPPQEQPTERRYSLFNLGKVGGQKEEKRERERERERERRWGWRREIATLK